MNCPRIIQGSDWHETEKWPLVLDRGICFLLPRDLGARFEFYSGRQLLAEHHSATLIIRPGYACDGYSPVLRLLGKWRRLTPDPGCGQAPAVLHDFARQFLPVAGCPWDREDTDDWFWLALRGGRIPAGKAGIYHQAVAGCLGTAYLKLTRKRDPNLYIVRHSYP